MIDEVYGLYKILMFYDNEYNHANGEDLQRYKKAAAAALGGAVAVACTIVVNKNQLLDFDFLGFLGWFL